VALVDVGGGTTDLAIFEKGSLWHTGVLQVGGEHFTNDVAVALRTPVNEAEKIKKKHGCALTSMVPDEDSIEVPSVGGRKPASWPARYWGRGAGAGGGGVPDDLQRGPARGFDRSLNSGVVLTGGGGILEGMPEIAEQIFDMPVRRGTPSGIGGSWTWWRARSTPRRWAWCSTVTATGRARDRRVAAGGDGDLREGHRASHGLAFGLLLRRRLWKQSQRVWSSPLAPGAGPGKGDRGRAPLRDVRSRGDRLALQHICLAADS